MHLTGYTSQSTLHIYLMAIVSRLLFSHITGASHWISWPFANKSGTTVYDRERQVECQLIYWWNRTPVDSWAQLSTTKYIKMYTPKSVFDSKKTGDILFLKAVNDWGRTLKSKICYIPAQTKAISKDCLLIGDYILFFGLHLHKCYFLRHKICIVSRKNSQK